MQRAALHGLNALLCHRKEPGPLGLGRQAGMFRASPQVCKQTAGLTSKVQDDARAESDAHVANEWPHPCENGDGRPHDAEWVAVRRPDVSQVGVRAVSPSKQGRS